MKNLYLLPSPNPSRLYYFGDSPELRLTKYPNLFRAFERSTQHIYITGDGTLNEGDWTIWKDQLFKVDSNNAYSYTNNVTLAYAIKYLKKVILTTESLDGVQAIPEEFLKWYIENQNCKEVIIIEKSRCCGRCNGVDDLCYTDMCCNDHQVYGCETCYGKKVEYSVTIPKDKIMERFIANAKQETLEEVAHKMLDDYGIKSMGQSIGVLEVKKLMVKIAKWQQEQDAKEIKLLREELEYEKRNKTSKL